MNLSTPQEYIISSQKDINLFMGGVGSGKTYLDGVISVYFVSNYPQLKGFVGANTYGQLNSSTLFRIRWVWENIFNLKEGTHYVVGIKPPANFSTAGHHFDRYNDIISFKNGAIIFIGSLENAKAHDGKEFAWAILDETKDSKEDDVKEIIMMRLREKGLYTIDGTPWNPLYISTSPAKVKWINDWFKLDGKETEIKKSIYSETDFYASQFENKCIAVSSTYHNLKNLPENYIENKKFDLTTEQFNRLIYADPFMKSGGEFYSSFDRTKHVMELKFKKDGAIHVTFDQNVVPYITGVIAQIEEVNERYIVNIVKEYCLPNPKNKTEKLCQEIERDLSGIMDNGVFFYGDASGKKRDTRGIENDYDIVERVWGKYLDNFSNRVLRSNPSVKKRRDFINKIFEGKLPIEIYFNTTCKETITDFEYIKETPTGEKLKETSRDEKNGVTYEKLGHTSDAVDYLLCSCFKDYFKD